MYKKPYKVLDRVLKYLSLDFNSSKSLEDITKYVFKKDLNNETDLNLSVLLQQYEKDTLNAILFLTNENLVTSVDNINFFITSKGFLKIKTESFSEEIKNKTTNMQLQRLSWVCSFIALLFSTYVLFFKSESSPTIVLNCNHKVLTKKIVP